MDDVGVGDRGRGEGDGSVDGLTGKRRIGILTCACVLELGQYQHNTLKCSSIRAYEWPIPKRMVAMVTTDRRIVAGR